MKVIKKMARSEVEKEKKMVLRSRLPAEEIPEVVENKVNILLNYRNASYSRSMCEKVVMLMMEGRSRYEVAAELGVCTSTLSKWEREKEDFAEALHLGDEASRAWWEKIARENILMGTAIKFNTSVWGFNMKNRFGWQDKCEFEDKRSVRDTEIERKKEEIERTGSTENTAKILEVLKGIGAFQSGTKEITDSSDEQVHKDKA